MEATLIHDGGSPEVITITAPSALSPGEVIQLADKRAAVYAGLRGCASGDPAAVYVSGLFDVASASGTTISAGVVAWFDPTGNQAEAADDSDDNFPMGTARIAKTSGQLVMRVDLNNGFSRTGAEVA